MARIILLRLPGLRAGAKGERLLAALSQSQDFWNQMTIVRKTPFAAGLSRLPTRP